VWLLWWLWLLWWWCCCCGCGCRRHYHYCHESWSSSRYPWKIIISVNVCVNVWFHKLSYLSNSSSSTRLPKLYSRRRRKVVPRCLFNVSFPAFSRLQLFGIHSYYKPFNIAIFWLTSPCCILQLSFCTVAPALVALPARRPAVICRGNPNHPVVIDHDLVLKQPWFCWGIPMT
jgi:hypothetical protein